MTAPCPRGPRYPSRRYAKRARKDAFDRGAVRVAKAACDRCGGVHLEPNLTNHLTNRDQETR